MPTVRKVLHSDVLRSKAFKRECEIDFGNQRLLIQRFLSLEVSVFIFLTNHLAFGCHGAPPQFARRP
jgi:hypothetical protein